MRSGRKQDFEELGRFPENFDVEVEPAFFASSCGGVVVKNPKTGFSPLQGAV
jgi:hypothetical protein